MSCQKTAILQFFYKFLKIKNSYIMFGILQEAKKQNILGIFLKSSFSIAFCIVSGKVRRCNLRDIVLELTPSFFAKFLTFSWSWDKLTVVRYASSNSLFSNSGLFLYCFNVLFFENSFDIFALIALR